MTLILYIPNQQKIIAQEISTRRNYFVVFYVLRRTDSWLISFNSNRVILLSSSTISPEISHGCHLWLEQQCVSSLSFQILRLIRYHLFHSSLHDCHSHHKKSYHDYYHGQDDVLSQRISVHLPLHG